MCDLRANDLGPELVCDIFRADGAVEVYKLSDDSYDDCKARGKAAGNDHLPLHSHLNATDNDPRQDNHDTIEEQLCDTIPVPDSGLEVDIRISDDLARSTGWLPGKSFFVGRQRMQAVWQLVRWDAEEEKPGALLD